MKKWIVRLLLLVVFSFPYVYFSMYQDLINSSMIGYGLMIASLTLLIFICKKTHNLPVCAFGNIISFIASYLLITCSIGEKWSYYYFSSNNKVQGIIFICLSFTFIALGFIQKKKKNN